MSLEHRSRRVNVESEKGKEAIKPKGRILYLTEDPELLKKQLEGEQIDFNSSIPLISRISTDEIIPNKVCLSFTGKEDEDLGAFLLTGLRGGIIKPNDIKDGGFSTIVAGGSYGRGSSRMHAQISHKEARIEIIVADVERIFGENCTNYGIYNLNPSDPNLAEYLSKNEFPNKALLSNLPPISTEIITRGGILPFLEAFNNGEVQLNHEVSAPRPMTITEKIIAKNVVDINDSFNQRSVKPGEQYVVTPSRYYGYELQTTVTRRTLGENYKVARPDKLILYNDHTALLPSDNPAVDAQLSAQARFAEPLISAGTKHYLRGKGLGVDAICHTNMIEEHALPGELILGNDSHTCTLGALNTLAIGKGAADLAGAIAYDQMVVTVPESIRFNLNGKLKKGTTAKDLILSILSIPELRDQKLGSNRVFEFGGEALENLVFDEQIKLTNMTIEGQGFTGIIEPNNKMIEFLMKSRNLTREEVDEMLVYSDPNAEYAARLDFDLSGIEPTIALPGDAQNGIPLSEIKGNNIEIQRAYIGSCTHGTTTDLRQAAEILKGNTVKEGVTLFVQASSMKNLQLAREEGLIDIFTEAGAQVLLPGCGACMNAGPGSTKEGEIGIFATNRNFPGRTGAGETYLASPAVVAASAIKGKICSPEDLAFTSDE